MTALEENQVLVAAAGPDIVIVHPPDVDFAPGLWHEAQGTFVADGAAVFVHARQTRTDRSQYVFSSCHKDSAIVQKAPVFIVLTDAPPAGVGMDVLDAYLEKEKHWVIRWGLSQFADETDHIHGSKTDAVITFPAFGTLYLVEDPQHELWELPAGVYADSVADSIRTGAIQMPDGAKKYAQFQLDHAVTKFPFSEYGSYAATNYVDKHHLGADFAVFEELRGGSMQEWLVRRSSVEPGVFPPEGLVLYLNERFGADISAPDGRDGLITVESHCRSDAEYAVVRKYLIGFKKTVTGKPKLSHIMKIAEALGVHEEQVVHADPWNSVHPFDPEGSAVQRVPGVAPELKTRLEKEGEWVVLEYPAREKTWCLKKTPVALALYLSRRFGGASYDPEQGLITIRDENTGALFGRDGWHIKALEQIYNGGAKFRLRILENQEHDVG